LEQAKGFEPLTPTLAKLGGARTFLLGGLRGQFRGDGLTDFYPQSSVSTNPVSELNAWDEKKSGDLPSFTQPAQ
jgi:hypothetical protein